MHIDMNIEINKDVTQLFGYLYPIHASPKWGFKGLPVVYGFILLKASLNVGLLLQIFLDLDFKVHL